MLHNGQFGVDEDFYPFPRGRIICPSGNFTIIIEPVRKSRVDHLAERIGQINYLLLKEYYLFFKLFIFEKNRTALENISQRREKLELYFIDTHLETKDLMRKFYIIFYHVRLQIFLACSFVEISIRLRNGVEWRWPISRALRNDKRGVVA